MPEGFVPIACSCQISNYPDRSAGHSKTLFEEKARPDVQMHNSYAIDAIHFERS